MLRLAWRCLGPRGRLRAVTTTTTTSPPQQQKRGLAQWSVETEHHHKYEDPAKIIDEALINRLLEETKAKVRWGAWLHGCVTLAA